MAILGTLHPDSKDSLVVGGGIAGLLIADRLTELGHKVTLYEKSDRIGGLIQTTLTPFGLSESAAHSLLVSPAVAALAKRFALNWIDVDPHSKARWIHTRGRTSTWPLSSVETLGLIYRALTRRAHSGLKGATLETWGGHFLGDAAVCHLVSPAVQGIYAAHPSELVAEDAFPTLRLAPGESLLSLFKRRKARAPLRVFENGMGSLVEALGAHLAKQLGDRFITGREVTDLKSLLPSLSVKTNIIFATPAHITANLIRSFTPQNTLDETELLASLPYAPIVSATVFIPESQFDKIPRGVGVLIRRDEGLRPLGILYNSSAFPRSNTPTGVASLTFLWGGTQDPSALDLDDVELLDDARTTLLKLGFLSSRTPVKEFTLHAAFYRWSRAIPVYGTKRSTAIDALCRGWCSTPGRLVFGNYTGAVSLRGMIEAVSNFQPLKF